MKKVLSLLLVVCMMIPVFALAEEASAVVIGQTQYAAHGTKCFAVLTVAMEGDTIVAAHIDDGVAFHRDTIVAAHIDEYQFMSAETSVGVPNSDADFGTNFPEGMVLASKRVNNEAYSANMAGAGSTVALADNYAAIEAFVTGKTVADLEAEIEGKTAEDMVDAVSGCTLVDTLGYVQGLIEAAKAAQ